MNQAAEQQADNLMDAEEKRVSEAKAAKPELDFQDGGTSGKRLKSFIERVERLEEEKRALSEDVRDVYGEAKATGFDAKIMRKIVALRKQNIEKRREEAELIELYKSAIGMAD